MSSPAFVRLGPSSAPFSQALNDAPPGPYPNQLQLECAQVPKDFGEGSPVWIWLGSNNNKGIPTPWVQGIRALGRCVEKEQIGKSQYRIVLDDLLLLPRSIEKIDLLDVSPESYARQLSSTAIVGLNNYSSQVVQLLTSEEFATIGALAMHLLPEMREALLTQLPEADAISIIQRPAAANSANSETKAKNNQTPIEIDDDDEVYQSVLNSVNVDMVGGVLFVGSPGTGKTWYARQVARKLTGDNSHRIREIQFHPSYQYEDFVEGYVPDAQSGFRMAPKHLLEMIEIANATDGPVVIIIDEFSRTDPARVLGETLTYMDGPMRNVEFFLPSGRKTSIPKNLVFLATMNPDDRSVDEIDDAMDRRWSKITLEPSAEKVREFLRDNGAAGGFIAPVIQFFQRLQKQMPVGHALFRRVKDAESLRRLWDTQLKYQMSKRFRYDPAGLGTVEALWVDCKAGVDVVGQGPAPQVGNQPEPEAGAAAE